MDLGLKGLRVLVTGGARGSGGTAPRFSPPKARTVSICARDQKGVTARSRR
jgi:3-oxoacyl-[acyl-carrier protein] reductase